MSQDASKDAIKERENGYEDGFQACPEPPPDMTGAYLSGWFAGLIMGVGKEMKRRT